MREALQDGLERLHTKWPQAHLIEHETGNTLVTVPSVLPSGYDQTICTVLFVAPAGFPACFPENFWTDIDIDLAKHRTTDGLGHGELWPTKHPQKTARFSPGEGYFHPAGRWRSAESRFTFERLWPQWRTAMIWRLRLQQWSPIQCSLFTYMMCIRQRIYWTPRYVA